MVTLQSVSLHVADVERSVAFYTKLPGAAGADSPSRSVRKNQVRRGLYPGVHGGPPKEKEFHIELNAPGPAALYDELKAAGIEPDSPPTKRRFGRIQFQVHDPDGNILEFDTP